MRGDSNLLKLRQVRIPKKYEYKVDWKVINECLNIKKESFRDILMEL